MRVRHRIKPLMVSRQAFKQALKLCRGHALQVLIQSWHNIWAFVSQLPPVNTFIALARLSKVHPRGLSILTADHDAAVLHPTVKAIPLSHEAVSTLAVGNCQCDLRMADAGPSKSVEWELIPTLGHSSPKLIRSEHLAAFGDPLLERDMLGQSREDAIVLHVADW
jgi:hypothetical protein